MTVHEQAMERFRTWVDREVIQNAIRSNYVEFQIGVLLGDDWSHVGLDWGGWDFERDGVRLEVKQSAASQTWKQSKPSSGEFDIARRTGFFDGAEWFEENRRFADLYVFAWHGRWQEDDDCDQRDEMQWEYYVVRADELPDQKSISIGPLRRLVGSIGANALRAVVDERARSFSERSCELPKAT